MEGRDRFLREARTAAKLSHPNIVPIFAVDEVGEFVYYVMAYVAGETLGQRVQSRGPLPPSESARVLKEIGWAGPSPLTPSPLIPKRKRRQYRMTGGVSDPPQPGAMHQRHLPARTASCDSARLVTGAAIACPYQAADGTWSRQLITSLSQGSCHGRGRDHPPDTAASDRYTGKPSSPPSS